MISDFICHCARCGEPVTFRTDDSGSLMLKVADWLVHCDSLCGKCWRLMKKEAEKVAHG